MYDISKVIKIAEAEVGYLEKSRAAYKANPNILSEKTAGAGSDNYTKYGKEMHDIYPAVMDFPASWCDAFVDWCFQKAYGVSNAKGLLGGNFDDYTPNSAGLYKNKKAYIKRGEGMPKVGDQIFFNNGTRINHTGLVYAVDANKVYTIEGNTSAGVAVVPNGGGVHKKSYSLTNSRIDGYGRPNYGLQVDTPAPVKKDDYPLKTFIQDVQASFGFKGTDLDGIAGPKTLGATITLSKSINYKHKVVKAVQKRLISLGYPCGASGADGHFGNDTEKAVKGYQATWTKNPDGVIDAKQTTWKKLLGMK